MAPMIKLRVKELLKERDRTLYWLWKQTGIRYATLLNMKQGKTVRIDLSAVESLCRALECFPSDLLTIESRKARKRGK